MSKKVYVDLSQQDVQDIINAYEKDIEKYNKQKEVIDKIKEKVRYYRSAKYGTYDSDDILADLSCILLEEIE